MHYDNTENLPNNFSKRVMIKLGLYKKGSIRPLSIIENLCNSLIILTCIAALSIALVASTNDPNYGFNYDKVLISLLSIASILSVLNKFATDSDWKKARKIRSSANRQIKEYAMRAARLTSVHTEEISARCESNESSAGTQVHEEEEVYEIMVSDLEEMLIQGGLLPRNKISLPDEDTSEGYDHSDQGSLNNIVELRHKLAPDAKCRRLHTHKKIR